MMDQQTNSVRPYHAGGADLDAMLALIQAAWQPFRRPVAHFHIGDLYWRLRYPAYEQTLWLWEDAENRLLGFAQWSAAERTLEMQVHPQYAPPDLEMQMLAWAEAQPSIDGDTDTPPLNTIISDANLPLIASLETQGYRLQEKYFNHHHRQLDDTLETPQVPEGYTVRSLHGPEELAARVQGHRAGWQSVLMTEAVYERMMQLPGYRSDLDFVVVAPDGTFAATCNCWLDAQNGVALFEPVSTHPEHRRKGLARAMILHGLHQLRALRATDAWVGSFSHNPASTRLYESCGMRVVHHDRYNQQ